MKAMTEFICSKIRMRVNISKLAVPGMYQTMVYPFETFQDIQSRINCHVGGFYGRFETSEFQIGTFHEKLKIENKLGDMRVREFVQSNKPFVKALASIYVDWMDFGGKKWFRMEHVFAPHTLTVTVDGYTHTQRSQFSALMRSLLLSSKDLKQSLHHGINQQIKQLQKLELDVKNQNKKKKYFVLGSGQYSNLPVTNAKKDPQQRIKQGNPFDGFCSSEEHIKHFQKRLLENLHGIDVKFVCSQKNQIIFLFLFWHLIV